MKKKHYPAKWVQSSKAYVILVGILATILLNACSKTEDHQQFDGPRAKAETPIINNLSIAQAKIYAVRQENKTSGICLGCEIQNPQNAVGSNENDYSTMAIGIGVIGRVEQTLIFPAFDTKKIIIGIGSNNIPLSVALLNGVTIETMYGTSPNNDAKIISSNILKIGLESSKATVELNPTEPYDRIKIVLNGGLLNLSSGLRIYYAYQEDPAISYCPPPFVPKYYYPFNINLNDEISGRHLSSKTNAHLFNLGMICGKGITTVSTDTLHTILDLNHVNAHTISFWAKTDPIQAGAARPSITIDTYYEKLEILPDSVVFNYSEQIPTFGLALDRKRVRNVNQSTQWNHYLITTYNNSWVETYINGILFESDFDNAPIQLSNLATFEQLITGSLKITLDRAQIDELVIYGKELSNAERNDLVSFYQRLRN